MIDYGIEWKFKGGLGDRLWDKNFWVCFRAGSRQTHDRCIIRAHPISTRSIAAIGVQLQQAVGKQQMEASSWRGMKDEAAGGLRNPHPASQLSHRRGGHPS